MTRDLRKYSRQTTVRLIIGAVLILFIIGDGLIYLIYGPASAVTGVICLIGGLLPVVVIIFFLWLIDWIVHRADRQ